MARYLEQLCTGVILAPDRREPSGATPKDRRRHRDRFDVVDRRRTAVKADARRKRRLQARLALLAFQAFDLRGFLSADIRARAALDEDVANIARTAGILADETRVVSLQERGQQGTRPAAEPRSGAGL